MSETEDEHWNVWRDVVFDWLYFYNAGAIRRGRLFTLPHVWFFPWNKQKAQAIADTLNADRREGERTK
jgi:hypothetical protein